MTAPKKLKKKASTQQDSMKSKNSEIAKPLSVNKELKKKAVKDASSSQNKVSKSTYAEMITTAIKELKEERGSSRQAIMKHMTSTSKVVPKTFLVNKTIKKMMEEGRIIPGAPAGKRGSGSFKLKIATSSNCMKSSW